MAYKRYDKNILLQISHNILFLQFSPISKHSQENPNFSSELSIKHQNFSLIPYSTNPTIQFTPMLNLSAILQSLEPLQIFPIKAPSHILNHPISQHPMSKIS